MSSRAAYVAEQNPKAAAIKVEEIVDTSWLKKLDAEGFLDRVYGENDPRPGGRRRRRSKNFVAKCNFWCTLLLIETG